MLIGSLMLSCLDSLCKYHQHFIIIIIILFLTSTIPVTTRAAYNWPFSNLSMSYWLQPSQKTEAYSRIGLYTKVIVHFGKSVFPRLNFSFFSKDLVFFSTLFTIILMCSDISQVIYLTNSNINLTCMGTLCVHVVMVDVMQCKKK